MRVPLASTGLRESDIESAIEVLRSGNLTMGRAVREFESAMAQYLGTKHFIMVNSGSSANLLMLEALLRPTSGAPRLHPGDSVLVPAIAWPTTVWPVIQLGLNPIFVDIDPGTLAMDLRAAEEILDVARIPVRGAFVIHPLGLSVSPKSLEEFSNSYKLEIVSDVCESLGSWSEDRHAGTSSLLSSYSFYFSHHITTMEGGGIATDDSELADDLRSMRSHGWSRDRSDATFWHDGYSQTDSRFMFVSTGYNLRPMEIQAAIGIQQLKNLNTFVRRRQEIASYIHEAIRDSQLRIIGFEHFIDNPMSHSWMLLPLQVLGPNAQSRRARMVDELSSIEIETRPVLTGNFVSQPAIQRITRQSLNPDSYTQATQISSTSFMVSCHHDLSDSQVDYLASSLERLTL